MDGSSSASHRDLRFYFRFVAFYFLFTFLLSCAASSKHSQEASRNPETAVLGHSTAMQCDNDTLRLTDIRDTTVLETVLKKISDGVVIPLHVSWDAKCIPSVQIVSECSLSGMYFWHEDLPTDSTVQTKMEVPIKTGDEVLNYAVPILKSPECRSVTHVVSKIERGLIWSPGTQGHTAPVTFGEICGEMQSKSLPDICKAPISLKLVPRREIPTCAESEVWNLTSCIPATKSLAPFEFRIKDLKKEGFTVEPKVERILRDILEARIIEGAELDEKGLDIFFDALRNSAASNHHVVDEGILHHLRCMLCPNPLIPFCDDSRPEDCSEGGDTDER